MFKNPNPTCSKDCRFICSQKQEIKSFNDTIYDKNGNIIDGNEIYSQSICCLKCNKNWRLRNVFSEVTITEL